MLSIRVFLSFSHIQFPDITMNFFCIRSMRSDRCDSRSASTRSFHHRDRWLIANCVFRANRSFSCFYFVFVFLLSFFRSEPNYLQSICIQRVSKDLLHIFNLHFETICCIARKQHSFNNGQTKTNTHTPTREKEKKEWQCGLFGK